MKIKKSKKECIGWILAEENKPGVLALDVDGSSIGMLKIALKQLQEKEKLGNCVIATSSIQKHCNHYHIYFFWDILPWKRIVKIIDNFPLADKKFKDFKKTHKFLRMRLRNLPKRKTTSPLPRRKKYFMFALFILFLSKQAIYTKNS